VPSQPPWPTLRSTLQLENDRPGRFRLTRTLALESGLQATLRAEGTDAADLLASIEAVPAMRQFQIGDGAVVALHLRMPLRLAPASAAGSAGAEPVLILERAETCVAGLTLKLLVSAVRGYPAELELLRGDSAVRELPNDLLAVLGHPWHKLTATGRGWQGAVLLRGAEPRRSHDAEERLRRTVAHLVRTLGEPPARFHERFRGARWAVACRGMLPPLACVAVVVAALLIKRNGSPYAMSVLGLLANIAPPLLMGLFFLRREMPRIGLPRLPRRPSAGAWPVGATPVATSTVS
jgi:hypothetical protein